jgi:hypothetical protein
VPPLLAVRARWRHGREARPLGGAHNSYADVAISVNCWVGKRCVRWFVVGG